MCVGLAIHDVDHCFGLCASCLGASSLQLRERKPLVRAFEPWRIDERCAFGHKLVDEAASWCVASLFDHPLEFAEG